MVCRLANFAIPAVVALIGATSSIAQLCMCDAGHSPNPFLGNELGPCLGAGGVAIDTRWGAVDPPCIDVDCYICCREGKQGWWA
jgi:hypothetical protein